MLKSVWLTNLIISSLNDPSSLLSSYYSHLMTFIGKRESFLTLFEPEQVEETHIFINKNTACLLPSLELQIEEKLYNEAITNKKIIVGKISYLPLFFHNVSTFGILIIKHSIDKSTIEKLTKLLIAFSSILYSEANGSILKSFHKTVIKAKNLCVNYTNGKIVNQAVKNLNVEINEKEFTIIVGSSGSGKSTFLNVVGGMLSATSGKVLYNNIPITSMNETEKTNYRKDVVGFVFQHYNLINDLTAEENIKIAAALVRNPLSVDEVLDMVGLKDKKKSYPNQMSGGEQQRVCIARALVKNPKLLLCDEPTGALDTENSKIIIKILQEISKNQGLPVVVITHNPTLTILADHCITISNGTVINDAYQPFPLSADSLE